MEEMPLKFPNDVVPETYYNDSQIEKASAALVKHILSRKESTKSLLGDAGLSPIFVRITQKRIPGRSKGAPIQM